VDGFTKVLVGVGLLIAGGLSCKTGYERENEPTPDASVGLEALAESQDRWESAPGFNLAGVILLATGVSFFIWANGDRIRERQNEILKQMEKEEREEEESRPHEVDVSTMSEPDLSLLLSQFKITDRMPDGIMDYLFRAWTHVDGDDPITSEQRAKFEQACRILAAELREQGHEAAHYVDGMQFEKVVGEYAVVSFERNPLAHALFVDTAFRHLAQDLWERGGGAGYRLWFTLRM
jgi:hypothetical protein